MENPEWRLWMRAIVALMRATATDMKREAHERDAEASPLTAAQEPR